MRRAVLLMASMALAVLLASGATFLAALVSARTASAASGSNGASFAVRCDFSHRNSDDPIVHPGAPGAAHRHDFFGNRSTKFDSTYESMVASTTAPMFTAALKAKNDQTVDDMALIAVAVETSA